MYRNKKDVDKHVESLMSKLPVEEFKSRAYSIATLYYEIGDYSSCQKYVEQYLTFKDNNAAAHKLLGQALQKLGQKENALEHFTTSLELDPSQTIVIPDKKDDFQWEGAGQQLFSTKRTEKSNNDSNADDSEGEDYDPHYEPIVPLPEKIVLTTGEEDEQRLFCERCTLFRYHEEQREWKERGVGDMKILHHPGRNTYRILLRREQVHKTVLNMLLIMDLELLPMNNSDRAWTWAGVNFAETADGEHEILAVRFKSIALSASFHDKVVDCVWKLQSAAAKALRVKDEVDHSSAVAALRLPKHLEDNARADIGNVTSPAQNTVSLKPNGDAITSQAADSTPEPYKQVHFQEHEEVQGDDEDYEDYYDLDDYEGYYNEDEEESTAMYACDGEVIIQQGDMQTSCPTAHIELLVDHDQYSPKIFITDSTTDEILADMVIQMDTEFQMSDNSCTWSGIDYTTNDPADKTVTINFPDSDSAMQFYDSCETNRLINIPAEGNSAESHHT